MFHSKKKKKDTEWKITGRMNCIRHARSRFGGSGALEKTNLTTFKGKRHIF